MSSTWGGAKAGSSSAKGSKGDAGLAADFIKAIGPLGPLDKGLGVFPSGFNALKKKVSALAGEPRRHAAIELVRFASFLETTHKSPATAERFIELAASLAPKKAPAKKAAKK